MGMRRALWFSSLSLVSCVEIGAFLCGDESQCARNDTVGVCEAEGYCSYEDDSCPSGRRFSELAGPFASQCTAPGGTTGTSGSPPSTTSSPTGDGVSDASSGDAGSTDGPVSDCGNGDLDAGEECDDGNLEDGDGCNADCVRAGEILWSIVHPGGTGDDAGWDVVALAGGGVAVAGYLSEAGGGTQIWVARYSGQGVEAWSDTVGDPAADDRGVGIVQTVDADLFVTGHRTTLGEPRVWLGRYSADGNPGETRDLDGSEAFAISAFATRVVVVGKTGFNEGPFVENISLGQSEGWRVEQPGLNARFQAVFAADEDEVFCAGATGPDTWVARVTPAGIETLATHDGPAGDQDWAQGIVVLDDRIAVAGLERSALASDIWVAGYDLSGGELWQTRPEPLDAPVDEEAEAIAVDAAGALVVAGFVTVDDRDAWLAKLGPDGTLIWERSYPELEGVSAARAVAVSPSGTIFLTGEIAGEDGTLDAWVAEVAP